MKLFIYIFLGKDSPSSKLLFAKNIPLFRELVVQFYQNIRSLPQVKKGDPISAELGTHIHNCHVFWFFSDEIWHREHKWMLKGWALKVFFANINN